MANRKHYHFDMMVSVGYVDDHAFNHKFGAVPAMSVNQTGTVWDVSDTLYPWDALDTPAVVNVERNNVADDGKTVVVQGLDADFNPVEDTIVIDGADTLGTVLFHRVNRAFVTNGGATNNVGNIDIEAGAAGGVTVACITANLGQTLMAVYTVPAGKTGYIYQGTATAQASADGTGFMMVRYGGQTTFRVGHTFEVDGAGGQYLYDFAFPIPVPEKSDIDIRITTRSNNGRYTAALDILLVDNDEA
jgi:hypothetical protein